MENLATESFNYNERLYKETVSASLPSRYENQLLEMAEKIKSEWEGLEEEVSMDDVLFRGLEQHIKAK